MSAYFILNHTADLAIEARGNSPAAAVEDLVEGLTSELFDRPPEGELRELEVVGVGEDPGEALIAFLGELLFLAIHERFHLVGVRGLSVSDRKIYGTALGADYGKGEEVEITEIKAATYHDLLFCEKEGVWRARVVFDL